MVKFSSINCLHIPFCDQLRIKNNHLEVGIELIFLDTDFENYFSIKSAANKIKYLLKTANMAISDTKILNTIAMCLNYKNHHHMKDKTYPNMEQLHQTLIHDVHEIYKKSGLNGLLPQNLPDHILKSCSYAYNAYAEEDEKLDLSGLFSIIMLIVLQDKSPDINGQIHFDITLEELDTYFHTYGISIHLEELQRIGFISMPKNTLPTVEDILNPHKERELILNPKYVDF